MCLRCQYMRIRRLFKSLRIGYGSGMIVSTRLRLFLFFSSCAAVSIQAQNYPDWSAKWTALVGTNDGLYGINEEGNAVPLWKDGEVRKILQSGNTHYMVGSRGISSSSDLLTWEARNNGLPIKVLKVYDGTNKSFNRIPQEIKDLEADPSQGLTLVTAVKDAVFLTRDGGKTWKNLGCPVQTNGIKAVAVASLPQTVVFVSHAIYGVHYLEADRKGARWTELNTGLDKMETTENPDEVSDLIVTGTPSGGKPEIWAAQSFKARIYRLDWEAKAFKVQWSDGKDFGTVESLDAGAGVLRFIREDGIHELQTGTAEITSRVDLEDAVLRFSTATGSTINCLILDPAGPENKKTRLSELWLLPAGSSAPLPFTFLAGYQAPNLRLAASRGKEGLYLPVNHAATPKLLAPYLETISKRGLDMVVIDMKDDYGRLRFAPRNQELAKKGRVFNPIDVDSLIATMKARNIWLVARIVVFKDPELAKYGGGRYAVWDTGKNQSWSGYYTTKKKKESVPSLTIPGTVLADEYETVTTVYDERWVDPYSEEVWQYTTDVCKELAERGFDEIQFDYIRFPTDGVNLGDARYRWKDAGMDMESAIISFLAHARANLDVPISLDIYGANGWYRTGARTGQEVELMSRYVDVICPMYYPSHFEQNFLAHAPAELRPYRIYYRGTLRTERIARGRVIVRPYVQSFFLNVSYDRKYYGNDYVKQQVAGVRDAGSPGLTYWNNSGRYDEIPEPAPPLAVRAPAASNPLLD